MGDYSDILYARPSFVEGMARALDLGGTIQEYNQSPTGAIADGYALRADWHAVGQGLADAFDRVKRDANAGEAPGADRP